MTVQGDAARISISEASRRGISSLVSHAETGADVVLERHGRPVAVVVGADRMRSILESEDDLRSAALVLARAATDSGARTSLDDVIESLGYARADLEAELAAEEDL